MTRRLVAPECYPRPLLAVAGHGLPGARRTFPTGPLSDEDWIRLVRSAVTQRMTGPLWAAVDAGALPATPHQADQARAAHRAGAARVLALERGLVDVVNRLDQRGIESIVLKGSAVANLDWIQPALRSFVDLDLLIRAADMDQAVRVLLEGGCVRLLEEPRPGFDRRFDKGVTLVAADGYEVDIHRTFVLGPWGLRVDLDALWEGCQEFRAAGRTFRALSDLNRFVHACFHASLGDWPLRLGSLRDVAEMMRDNETRAASRIARAESWGVQAIVASAVVDATRLLGLDTDDELTRWAGAYRPGRREHSYLALHTQVDKTFAAQAAAMLGALPRLRDKAAYAHALLLPRREYVAGRHPSPWTRLRYGLHQVRLGRPRRRHWSEVPNR